MSKIIDLVLGGAGLIGTELVKRLQAQGNEVYSCDIKSGCDLRKKTIGLFNKCDRVWFLAWDTGGVKYIENNTHQHAMYLHNMELMLSVFDQLYTTKKPFLFTTSQLAGVDTAYGKTKQLAEGWTKQLGGKVARLWNTYGWEEPNQRSHVITDLVLSGIRDRVVRCVTTGMERRRFMHKLDCVEGLVILFEDDKMYADIAGEAWLSIKQVADEIGRQLSVSVTYGDSIGTELLIEPIDFPNAWSQHVTIEKGLSMVIQEAYHYLEERKCHAHNVSSLSI